MKEETSGCVLQARGFLALIGLNRGLRFHPLARRFRPAWPPTLPPSCYLPAQLVSLTGNMRTTSR